MKRIVGLLIAFTLVLTSVSVLADGLSVFSDVDITTDEGIAVYTLYAEGIVKGYGDGTFGIDKSLTRAETSRMINLLFKYTDAGENTFSDVSYDDWYYDDVNIAVKAGFIVGFEDGTFRGNDPVTRQQACSIVARIVKPAPKQSLTITDAVDDWAKGDVQAIADAGLVALEDGGKFRATEIMTRGELALLLAQFVDNSGYTVDVPGDTKPDDTKPSDAKPDDPKPDNTDKDNNNSSATKPSIGGGSRPSGGSSGSNKPDDTKPEPPTFDNTEVLKNLNAVLSDIDSVTFIGAEKEIISVIKKDIQLTIEAGAKEYIGENYVNEHFADDLAKVRGLYSAMSQAARDRFVEKIAGFDSNTLAFLQNYFMNKD
ncbi:MAG: S-layer homology domain-containing protein [Clostridia bacterium]|nr:S-layer homology domain-containing protein [Clostridia bacterium]